MNAMRPFRKLCYSQCVVALILIAHLVAICSADTNGSTNEDVTRIQSDRSENPRTARAKFTMAKLFDFERYKKAFKKQYSSIIEETTRARLFLGRAFRAFVSAISYKQRKSNIYLSINDMSDWTPEEVRKLYLRPFPGFLRESNGGSIEAKQSYHGHEPVPVASLDEIESAVSEIVEQGEDGLAMQLLNEERRKRRDLTPVRERHISLNDIDREPKDKADEIGQRVESNNPNYEPPELVSFGSSVSRPVNPIVKQVGDWLNNRSGNEFISQVIRTFNKIVKKNKTDDTKPEPATGPVPVPMPVPEPAPEPELVPEPELDLPDEIFIDHRDECMFAARNQGRCGSCYAFAAIAVYEWLYCKATGKKVAFSEQFPVDCGQQFGYGMQGCDGGYADQVSIFVLNHGLEMRASYPYQERADQCPYDRSIPHFATGYLRVSHNYVEYIDVAEFELALKSTPMMVAILVSPTFTEYGGGVDDGSTCDEELAHAMVLVGSGREDNQEYWLLRNSHGPTFGLSGYYKLNKKAKHCINQNAYLITGFTPYGNALGFNMWYHSTPIERHYHNQIALDVNSST